MNKPIYVGQATAKVSRLIIASIFLVMAGRAFNANAQTVTNLYSFGSVPNDGEAPEAPLVQGSDGNFYGTTLFGGTTNRFFGGTGYGTVFRISPSGSYTNLYSFRGRPNDGSDPSRSRLVQGNDGNFYGTTFFGGTVGAGSMFRISPSGTETNLYSFLGSANGVSPNGLVQGSDGNFYGITAAGGIAEFGENHGTVFRISPGGTFTLLYTFGTSPTDGDEPYDGLVQGSDGNFYGTTDTGGTNGQGTVFRISPSGTETNLYSFPHYPNDGIGPYADLVQGSDGNFYGTTEDGGTSTNCDGGCGTVFRISPGGSETILHSFGSTPNDGTFPFVSLVQGSDGNFYGTTEDGGTSTNCDGGCGTVFRISPGGSYSNLYSFGSTPNDGQEPSPGLVQGSDGNFYGTTYQGGTQNSGTVFRLTVPLNPPANQISAFQIAGNDVTVLIPSVTYETYQLQFSSSMHPTNWVNVPGVSVTNSIGALLTVTNLGGATAPLGFYRFDITP